MKLTANQIVEIGESLNMLGNFCFGAKMTKTLKKNRITIIPFFEPLIEARISIVKSLLKGDQLSVDRGTKEFDQFVEQWGTFLKEQESEDVDLQKFTLDDLKLDENKIPHKYVEALSLLWE